MANINLMDIKNFFEMDVKTFSTEWKELTEQDKKDIHEMLAALNA